LKTIPSSRFLSICKEDQVVQSEKMPERQEVYQQVGEQLTSSFSILVVG
jgi:hypothetical protein